VHGGSWREPWERDTIEPLAIDLAERGYATWNVEYRRVGPYGGGWPASCADVAAAARHLVSLADAHALDLERLVVVGHSAGGHLALWAAAELRADLPPQLVVSIAGLPDLVECAYRGLGNGGDITAGFMGGEPEELPDAYAAASPAARLPLGVPQLLVQGWKDAWNDLVDVNRLYAKEAAAAGDAVELLEFADEDHFDVIDPGSASWAAVVERLLRLPVG
jgi:acetyl esterase/lipase